jgi:hypothetical protein
MYIKLSKNVWVFVRIGWICHRATIREPSLYCDYLWAVTVLWLFVSRHCIVTICEPSLCCDYSWAVTVLWLFVSRHCIVTICEPSLYCDYSCAVSVHVHDYLDHAYMFTYIHIYILCTYDAYVCMYLHTHAYVHIYTCARVSQETHGYNYCVLL